MVEWFDPAGDLSVCDGLEPLAYLPPDGREPLSAGLALRAKHVQREAEPSRGRYLEHDVCWHVPAQPLPVAPLVGGVLRDADETSWTILRVERAALGRRWLCWARNLALCDGLLERVSILRALWRRSPTGAALPQWVVWRAAVPARLQPAAAALLTADDRTDLRRTHVVYLAEKLPRDPWLRIAQADRQFAVLSWTNEQRLDSWIAVQVEEVPAETGV